jgi:hypothetical protein
VGVNFHHYAQASLSPGKEPVEPIEQEADWVSEPVWTCYLNYTNKCSILNIQKTFKMSLQHIVVHCVPSSESVISLGLKPNVLVFPSYKKYDISDMHMRVMIHQHTASHHPQHSVKIETQFIKTCVVL